MAEESLRNLLEIAVEVAEKAGAITLKYFQAGPAVETKPDMTPVTIADREAEAYIRRAIESRFPSDGVIGEEFGETRAEAERHWIVDPIDGTFSFIHGVPLYGVLIAIEQEGQSLLGVIHLPALNETVAAATGEGCHWQGQPAQVSTTAELSKALCLTTSTNFQADPAVGRVVRAARKGRTWGDCYGYVLVATGRADIMVNHPGMHIWDCAALLPIIEEAGGRFTDWSGERTIRGGNALASNGLLHAQALAHLSS